MADTFDDESGDDAPPQTLPTPPQSENNPASTMTKRGRPKGASTTAGASNVVKPKSKRKSTESVSRNRKALKEIPNEQAVASDVEEVDVPAASKVKKTAKEIPDSQEIISATSRLAQTKTKAVGRPPKPTKKEVIPETQAEGMEVDGGNESEGGDVEDGKYSSNQGRSKFSGTSKIQRQQPATRRRAGSASDTERGGNDPSMRRKLSDITARFEALQLKYQDLKDIAVQEGESNFDKLKQESEKRAAAAEALIASLRNDLAHQTKLASNAVKLDSQITDLEAANKKTTEENAALKSALAEAQQEVKSLQARLSASRPASVPADNSNNGKTPSSALKNQGPKTIFVGSAEAAKEARKSMLKEELYRDLTGLILRDVKSGEREGEDVYDCIQTGRNGTLHFHLLTSDGSSSSDNSAPASYEDAEFTYTPLLDLNRDKDLVAILPDYLIDEEGICFPRSNAAKFYGRVVDCLTKRIEVADG